MEAALIIVAFALVSGSYAYTWKSISRLWKAVEDLRTNELKHIKKRLDKLEGTTITQA